MKYLIQELACYAVVFALIGAVVVGWYMSISHVLGLLP